MKISRALLALTGLALLSTTAYAGACVPGNWHDYQQLTDCTIGVFTLNNFTYTDTGSVLADTNIAVAPFGLGLRFALTGYTGSGFGVNQSVTVAWTITSPTQPFTAERLDMEGTFTGSGIDQVVDPIGFSTYLDSGTSRPSTTYSFPTPPLFVNVSDQVKLETGLANAGTATITGYTVSFSVPEPATWTVLSAAFVALAAFRRRRRR